MTDGASSAAVALDDMLSKVDDLPMLPQVLVRIMQLNPEAEDYFETFENLVKDDPPFAVKVITVANSAAFAPVNPIVTIHNALTRLGSVTVRNLVASLAVQRVFMPTKENEIRLWEHSIKVAVASQAIARLLPDLRIDDGLAYLAGLLHDIGRFVMFEHAPENLLMVDESHWSSPSQLLKSDLEVFKYTHSELGFRACEKWGLPDGLSMVVRYHHKSIKKVFSPGSMGALIFCVQVADLISVFLLENKDFQSLGSEERKELIETRCLAGEIQKSLLSSDELNEILESLYIESEQMVHGMGFF